jgi:hypothetical protein
MNFYNSLSVYLECGENQALFIGETAISREMFVLIPCEISSVLSSDVHNITFV